MKYIVHRIDVNKNNIQEKLERFLNTLNGEVISVLPNIRPAFQLMGPTAKVDFLLIVEKKGVLRIRSKIPNYEDLDL
jgi:hypothetical protein